MGESVGCNPHDGLTQHLSLIVDAFDGQEDLAQGSGSNDVVHELHGEAAAQLDGLYVALARPREGGEEEAHGQGIIEVAQRIDKCGVPLLDNMVQFVAGFIVLEALYSIPLALPIGFAELPDKHLVLSELVDDGFMEEEFNIFDKVKCSGCCGTLVNFLLMLGFMRINTFQDAQPPEIRQAQLQLLPGFVSGDVIGGRASFMLLLFQAPHSSMLRKS